MTCFISPLLSGRVYRSQNLRGILAHARRARPVCVITRRDPTCEHRGQYPRGLLHVVYSDGYIAKASFASHSIMIDWTRERRAFRGVQTRHLDGETGYLTKPGIIGGQA
jgi:hypothetical protein